MSSKDNALDVYGYIFSEDMLKAIAEEENIVYDEISDIFEHMGLDYQSEFTGEAVRIDDNGNEMWNCESTKTYCVSSICYAPVRNWSSLFHAAYSSKEELLEDMRSGYGKWLPESNDELYAGIYHIVGTYFG